MNPDQPIIEYPLIAELVEPAEPRPWGFWATTGFSLALIGLFVALQTAVTIGFIVVKGVTDPSFGPNDFMELASNGLLLALAEWFSAPLAVVVIVLLVKLRRQLPVRDYLSLNQVPLRTYLVWTAIVLGFSVVMDLLRTYCGEAVVPEVMVQAYRTSVFPPLLWGAIIIAAPVFEELLFRGFFFLGIQQSRLGNVGAILITSFFWAIIHVQYDWRLMAWIFLLGVLLGVARIKSNSTYLTIALHVVLNLIATIQMEMFIWE